MMHGNSGVMKAVSGRGLGPGWACSGFVSGCGLGRLLASIIGVCVSVEAVGAAGWPGIFDPGSPVTIHLSMTTQDWDRVRFDQPSQSESWIPEVAPAWMHGEGETPIRVAVRRKGESDAPLPSAEDPRKVSLKIDINEYVSGQTWHDLKKLSLENGSSEPLKEGFAWIIHRQAEPLYGYQAALSGWVRLFINGEEIGVFTSAEQRDETFLRNHDIYSPTSSWLYKVDGSTVLEVGVSNSPAFENLQFEPFTSGPGGGRPGGGGGGSTPDLDAYLPQWVNMRGMLTLAACNAFTENSDSLFTHSGKNTFCADFNPPFPRTRRYFPWDLDTGINQGTASIYGSTTYQTKLLDHPWFGRVYEHIFRELLDGPLSTQALHTVLLEMEAGLAGAFDSDPYVYPGGVSGAFSTLRDWVATRNAHIRTQFRHAFVPRPIFNHPGGEVTQDFLLTISAPTGTVYYTLDGTDPRAPGGAPSPSALVWSEPLLMDIPRHITARTLVGTNWCGLPAEAFFTLARHGSTLRVTEIMYNPLDVNTSDAIDNDAYEFIEFRNTGAQALDLSGFYVDGLTFTFPAGFTVEPGAFVVLVRDPVAFAARYPGVSYDGVYLGKLSNAGEKIRVLRPDGVTVLSVAYDDDPPWVLGPDGLGYSLVNMNVDGNPDHAGSWRASAAIFGSPGAEDPEPSYAIGVVFNEILSHTDPPLEDAIELHNPTAEPIDISGWYLSDGARDAFGNLDPARLKGYRIPAGTVLPAGGFKVFYEAQFNGASAISPFALSEFGERVYLSAADSAGNLLGHIVALEFPPLENGVAFGRVSISTGYDHSPLAARTFGADNPVSLPEFRTGTGAVNAPPRVGPVVINEIMYNPPSHLTEFVEVHNVTMSSVNLQGWRLNGAGGFTFPTGASLVAGGFALIIDTNRISVADFRVARNVPPECAIYGHLFTLDNNGERLTLQKPNTLPSEPLFPIDSVRYNDKAPWPTEADNGGPSLERYDPAAYGNDPLNWRTTREGGSPGRPNLFDAGLAVTVGSRWKYMATPASLGTAWREPDYADTIWPDGHGPLGYGEEGLRTVVPFGPDPGNKYITTYFRKMFSLLEDPATLTHFTFEVMYDDGFVAYLNGVEVARRSMPAGEPAYDTLADANESGPYETIALGPEAMALLRQGGNLLAVEVHQADPASADLVWDARLSYQTLSMSVTAIPEANPSGGLFIDPVAVTLSSATADAEIRYTLDGSEPSETSSLYTAPLALSVTTVLKARAYALGYAPSSVATFVFDRIEQDGDGDGLPDAWEIAYFGNITSMTSTNDPDGDGASNAHEYICGTDPLDPLSVGILTLLREGDLANVRFSTISTDPDSLSYGGLNRYYSLQFVPSQPGPAAAWETDGLLDAIPADDMTHAYPISSIHSNGFYRLRIRLAP